MSEYVWLEVEARDVVVGDLYANGATVTEVVHGPRRTGPKDFDDVKRGQILLRCGESFATKGKSSRGVVVGRWLS